MRWVENTIISNEACAAVFGQTVVNEAVLCIDTTGGRGTCQGDSGGVLAIANGDSRLQVGITSFGSSAGCEQGFPAGFERVSAQIGWIDANTLE
jgi:secreted trypsin-like serine protease